MSFSLCSPSNTWFTTLSRNHNMLHSVSELKARKIVSSRTPFGRIRVRMASNQLQPAELPRTCIELKNGVSIMVNGCTGSMGRAVLGAAISAGLNLVPVALGAPEDAGIILDISGKQIEVHGPSDGESVLSSAFKDYPDLIIVDCAVTSAVNGNAELYCKVGVPFVMGTTGGDRELLYKTVEDSKNYAVISPQMDKQVGAFLAAMEIMADQFPGACSLYNVQVMELHQAGKLDVSGTAKAVISCFRKLGAAFELEQLQAQLIRDEMVAFPEEHLSGHAFHIYHLTSPDGTVSFEFQHNLCGRSIYAEGTIDAVLFLAKKVKSNADKRIFNMANVLREGRMR